jgi:phosphohistidine phosphatase
LNIWLFRHAKSSWGNSSLADFDRPLNARGERDGPKMASWLSRQPEAPQWIWSSDAVRALATAEFVCEGFSLDRAHLHQCHDLYLASPETMLDVLRSTPDDISSVAMVAHNPGTTYLLNLLSGDEVTDNVPTFGTARLTFSGSWPELSFGSCTVETLTAPKLIESHGT